MSKEKLEETKALLIAFITDRLSTHIPDEVSLSRSYARSILEALSYGEVAEAGRMNLLAQIDELKLRIESAPLEIRSALGWGEGSAKSANECTVPPAGWVCTRGDGHLGPCAASHGQSCEKVVFRGKSYLCTRGVGHRGPCSVSASGSLIGVEIA